MNLPSDVSAKTGLPTFIAEVAPLDRSEFTLFVIEASEEGSGGWDNHHMRRALATISAQQGRIELLEAVAASARAFRKYLARSINAGPLTNNPTREAMLLRALYSSLDALQAPEATPAPQVGNPAEASLLR